MRGNREDNLKYYSQRMKFNLTEKGVQTCTQINPLNTELNPICQ